jgi:hypothetical protein
MSSIDFLTSEPAGPMLQCGSMLIPRCIIEKSGLWDTRLTLFNDTEFFTRILLNSKGVKFSKGAKLYYRTGNSHSLTNQKKYIYFESMLQGSLLIKNVLLKNENSKRTRQLVSNLMQMSLHQMYPQYPDLEKKFKSEIKLLGGSTLKYKSGHIFNIIRFLFGWKTTITIKKYLYKIGYKP